MHVPPSSALKKTWASERSARWARRVASSLVALALAASAIPAVAQPPASEADKHTARELVAKGDEQYAEGDYEAALEAYRGAHLIMGVPTTGWEVARAQVALGQLLEAQETLEGVLAYPKRDDEPDAFTKARVKAEELLADLATRTPTLQVRVAGAEEADGATVSVDGVAWSEIDGAARPLNPGVHSVTASAPGFEDASREVELKERDRITVDLILRRQQTDQGLDPWPFVYTGAAVAGAGVIVGAITGGLSLARASDFKDSCPSKQNCPMSTKPVQEESITLAHVSTASLAVAGVGAAVGAVFLALALTGDGPDEGGATAAAVLGPGWMGLQGRF